MATVKDVAKLAGVSLGTVSNVLNGKTNNAELIEKVESAMRQLSYRPDAMARNMKNTTTDVIGVIIPDVLQGMYQDFLLQIEEQMRAKGYTVLVKFSRNNPTMEARIMESFLQQKVAGVILLTHILPKDQMIVWQDLRIPVVRIGYGASVPMEVDNIILDYREATLALLKKLKEEYNTGVAMIMENDVLQDGGLEELYASVFKNTELVKRVDGYTERGVRAFFELQDQCPDLKAVIVGNNNLAGGIRSAAAALCYDDLQLYIMKQSSLMDGFGRVEGVLSCSEKEMVTCATSTLLDAIDNPKLHDHTIRNIRATFKESAKDHKVMKQTDRELRFALYDSSSARSLKLLSSIYEKQTGQKIRFDLFSYGELEKLLQKTGVDKGSDYDGFMLDITWLEDIAESGLLKNLDEFWENMQTEREEYGNVIIRRYCMDRDHYFAIPFMSGEQLLFYQKSLFEDKTLQIQYQRQFLEPLAPPATWKQFNAIARFFTKKYNEYSPVNFGVSMANGENVYLAIEFLDRLWAYGGRIFDENEIVDINSPSALQAMRSIHETSQYASGKDIHSWDEAAREFCDGESAMVHLYNSDVGSLSDYSKSVVAGNLGCTTLPGNTSVTGGWSLGLNTYGNAPEEAMQFLTWLLSGRRENLLTVLGGSPVTRESVQTRSRNRIEPWSDLAGQVALTSRLRVIPKSIEKSWRNQLYSSVIPIEVMKVLKGQIDEETALDNLEREIKELQNISEMLIKR